MKKTLIILLLVTSAIIITACQNNGLRCIDDGICTPQEEMLGNCADCASVNPPMPHNYTNHTNGTEPPIIPPHNYTNHTNESGGNGEQPPIPPHNNTNHTNESNGSSNSIPKKPLLIE